MVIFYDLRRYAYVFTSSIPPDSCIINQKMFGSFDGEIPLDMNKVKQSMEVGEDK